MRLEKLFTTFHRRRTPPSLCPAYRESVVCNHRMSNSSINIYIITSVLQHAIWEPLINILCCGQYTGFPDWIIVYGFFPTFTRALAVAYRVTSPKDIPSGWDDFAWCNKVTQDDSSLLHKALIVLRFLLSRWCFTVQMKSSLWGGLRRIFKTRSCNYSA